MTSQKTNDVGSATLTTPKSTSHDTTPSTNATNTLEPPVPNILMLVALFILTLVTIYAGYVHGGMSIAKVYHSLTNFT